MLEIKRIIGYFFSSIRLLHPSKRCKKNNIFIFWHGGSIENPSFLEMNGKPLDIPLKKTRLDLAKKPNFFNPNTVHLTAENKILSQPLNMVACKINYVKNKWQEIITQFEFLSHSVRWEIILKKKRVKYEIKFEAARFGTGLFTESIQTCVCCNTESYLIHRWNFQNQFP